MAKKKLKTYEVRVTWTMYGTYFVDAKDEADAFRKAQDMNNLPESQEYADNSMEYNEACEVAI